MKKNTKQFLTSNYSTSVCGASLYMRCCGGVIDIVVITPRHIGGILNMNRNGATIRKSENSYAKVMHRPCISIGLYKQTCK